MEPSAEQLPQAPGTYDLVFTTPTKQALSYTLQLPATASPKAGAPLVLVLHYGGQASGFYGRPLIEQLFAPAWAELDAILVAPVTLGGDWRSTDNEQAVMALFEMLEHAYHTDRGRRVIAGYSMGAVGTWHLIDKHPGYFSAAVPVSGFGAPTNLCTTPIYALHSNADALFDAEKLRGLIDSQRAAKCDAEVDFIADVDHFNIPAFAPLLSRTLPWLRTIWSKNNDEDRQ